MKHFIKKHGLTLVIAAVTAAVATGGPVVARTIADFARNADKVDERHAVGPRASLEKRAGRLVATNRKGFLPNDIIRKAPAAGKADRLGRFGPSAFVHRCQAGALRGHASIPAELGSDFERVSGFATTFGGPLSPAGHSCHGGEATARRVAVGIYDARLAFIGWSCDEPMPPAIVTALVTVQSAEPRLATHEPICEDNKVHVRVRIFDLNGTPQDTPFSVAVLDEGGIPIP